MEITKTPIAGLLVITPKVFRDDRGYFLETFNIKKLEEAGINTSFVQDNESKSTQGVIRGLHYQLNPYAQGKLVRAIEGTVYDVAVDLRKDSPTFGQWYGVELSGENKKQFYIPRGFAHGFSVLSETAVFAYKCDAYYHPEAERGIRFDDPELNIDWKVDVQKAVVSVKDEANISFAKAEYNF
ncbi:dTDP-4-dehydrorhamnose 3,5-epimerase [Sunxiuqinia elliptica]|uniref:dTDP-4-dehydrorhamnose 3,5-epimerase n=1 Tax=Sunxiuqinia elliptica TaxID=655355 RepID=A0A4R6GPK9_9BACT|nr:dTDP-4-dehydrorhamnose 3,5-epimerase [Sunxiuqinia elliptica]TDN97209.1 dTDP-4-dehydrorhamnose 3,5-epimerase [Sunxiuqinia elliptica]TDO60607.1 dTDP-4-dehydrorhamnose 3,5-epimerase [Sunxiuqinia elliptica]